MRKELRNKLFIFLSFFLASCSTITQPSAPPTHTAWATREQQTSRIESWQISGKIGVQTAQNSGSATINWIQRQQSYSISLLGPLGSNSLKLSGQPGRVVMESADGKQASAASAEQLIAQQWGWHLPVSNLRYWIRGLPVPGIPSSSQFDSYHRLSALSQGGSHIQYLGYTNVNGIELPQKIIVSSPNITAKIIIYQWNLT